MVVKNDVELRIIAILVKHRQNRHYLNHQEKRRFGIAAIS